MVELFMRMQEDYAARMFFPDPVIKAGAPSGTITITENGTVDVTDYASAVVNVPPVYITEKIIEQGGISSSTGENINATNRIRTKDYLPIQWINEYIDKLNISDNIQYIVRLYAADDSFLGVIHPAFTSGDYFAPQSAFVSLSDQWIKNKVTQVYTTLDNPTATKCRLVFRYSNNADITPDSLENELFKIGDNTFKAVLA